MKRLDVALMLLLAAAVAGVRAEAPEAAVAESSATAAAGFGRAFGRVEYVEDGKAATLGAGFFDSGRLTFFIRSARSGKLRYMEVGSDGGFVWPLEAGEHVIVGYHVQRSKLGGATSWRTARLMAAISVPRPGQAAYVGDLRIDRGHRVVDAYDQALEPVRAKLADGGFEPVKSILRFEPAPGTASAVIGICTERWQLGCSATFRGVEPVQPFDPSQTGTVLHALPVTQTLSPLLEWKPARQGLAYDVVVYESLWFDFGALFSAAGLQSVRGLRGARIAYAQGLAEPRYALPSPLEPGKRYEWSVRLRDGDIVSSWSTLAYSMNLVIASRSASGQGFIFETPAQQPQ